jgi:hypothetical protein
MSFLGMEMMGSSTKMAVAWFQGHKHKSKFHTCDDPQKENAGSV